MNNLLTLLIVDDDEDYCELLSEYLKLDSYNVLSCHSAEAAEIELRQAERFGLMILDIMLPGKSGLELLQSIRPRLDLPVIMLTARGGDIDRILGLEMGADDYVSKPCNPREISARIKAVLRRSSHADGNIEQRHLFPQNNVQLGRFHLDPKNREAFVDEHSLALTGAEFNLLAYLMANAGTVLTKSQLTEWVLHRKLVAYDKSIHVHISRLRQKIQAVCPDEEVILTVRGEGYQFIANQA